MLEVWGRRSSANVQKVMWLIGELKLDHRHIQAGGPYSKLDAPEFLALATDRALGVQIIIAAVQLMQFELERPVVVRASDHAVLPELLHNLMRLCC